MSRTAEPGHLDLRKTVKKGNGGTHRGSGPACLLSRKERALAERIYGQIMAYSSQKDADYPEGTQYKDMFPLLVPERGHPLAAHYVLMHHIDDLVDERSIPKERRG